MADLWRHAVVEFVEADYVLAAVFEQQPELAREWLQRRLHNPTWSPERRNVDVRLATAVLSFGERRELLEQVPPRFRMDVVVVALVDRDPQIYHDLLSNEHLRRFHLAPLQGDPDGAWIELAKMARGAGYSPEEVAQATRSWWSVEFTGSESRMWSAYIERFAPLCMHDDPRIREVGQVGQAWAEQHRNRALVREYHEGVSGWSDVIYL